MAPSNVYYAGSASGWTSSANAIGVPDGIYAYMKLSGGSYKTYYMTTGNFGIKSADFPASTIIQAVTIRSRVYCDVTNLGSIGIVGCINDINQGNEQSTGNSSPTIITKSYTSGDLLTLSNLANGIFTVQVSGYSYLSYDVLFTYCDYVEVTVDYKQKSGLEMGCMF